MTQLDCPKTFNLRIPQDLRDWLAGEARRNMRSLNNEIVFRLSQSRLTQEPDGNKSSGR